MYKIIGGDGKEYGPVSAGQVRSWISAGRANLETRVKAEGSDTWSTVADIPELNGGPAATAADAVAENVEKAAASGGPLDIVSCYERSWALVRANLWPMVGIGIVMMLFYAASVLLEITGIHYVTPIAAGPIVGGIYFYMLRRIRGQQASPGDLLAGFSRAFLPLALIGIVNALIASMMVYLPTLFPMAMILIIPGLYLTVAYSFSYMLAVDKGMRFWDALETSRKVVTRQWWRVLGLGLLGIPFMLLGVVALVFGLAVTLPLIVGATLYAYEDMCGPST